MRSILLSKLAKQDAAILKTFAELLKNGDIKQVQFDRLTHILTTERQAF